MATKARPKAAAPLTTEAGIRSRLAATTGPGDWNAAMAEIRDANRGVPAEAGGPGWYRGIVLGGAYAEARRRWGAGS